MNWWKLRMSFLWVRPLPSDIVVGLSTLGPVGKKMKAPGTWGSVAGLLIYAVIFYPLHPLVGLLVNAVLIYLAMAFTVEAEERLMQRDPGMIILDELVAVPLVFLDC